VAAAAAAATPATESVVLPVLCAGGTFEGSILVREWRCAAYCPSPAEIGKYELDNFLASCEHGTDPWRRAPFRLPYASSARRERTRGTKACGFLGAIFRSELGRASHPRMGKGPPTAHAVRPIASGADRDRDRHPTHARRHTERTAAALCATRIARSLTSAAGRPQPAGLQNRSQVRCATVTWLSLHEMADVWAETHAA
jgi:hypothetical protein